MAHAETRAEDESLRAVDVIAGVVAARGLYRTLKAGRQTLEEREKATYAAIRQLPREAFPPEGHVFSVRSTTRRRVGVGKFFAGYPSHSVPPSILDPTPTETGPKSKPFLAEKIVVSGYSLIAIAEDGQAREIDPGVKDSLDFIPRPEPPTRV